MTKNIMLFDYINPFGEIIDKVGDAIDKNVTSDEERIELQKQIFEIESEITKRVLELEMKALETQASVLSTELKGDNILQKSWRPVAMIVFVSLIVSYWLGYNPENLTQTDREWLFRIITIGIGGYTVGRTIEKVAKNKDVNGLPWWG